jgi:hypothetical protein
VSHSERRKSFCTCGYPQTFCSTGTNQRRRSAYGAHVFFGCLGACSAPPTPVGPHCVPTRRSRLPMVGCQEPLTGGVETTDHSALAFPSSAGHSEIWRFLFLPPTLPHSSVQVCPASASAIDPEGAVRTRAIGSRRPNSSLRWLRPFRGKGYQRTVPVPRLSAGKPIGRTF